MDVSSPDASAERIAAMPCGGEPEIAGRRQGTTGGVFARHGLSNLFKGLLVM
jgi:hypothetical protein